MSSRSTNIRNKIAWFQSNSPNIFHNQIWIQMNHLYYNLLSNSDINQSGSGIQKKQTELNIISEFNGYEFKVVLEKTKYDILINVITYKKNNPLDCAIINIDRKKKIAYINNISYYDDCMKQTSDSKMHKKGSTLLKFILDFLKKNSSLEIKRIILSDNSIKTCNKCDAQVFLANMYFLLYGDTWYGKYGFRPYDIKNNIPDKNALKQYMKNKMIISKVRVKDINLIKYITGFNEKNKLLNVDKINKLIKIWSDRYLSDFLLELLKDYNKYCCLLAHIQPKLFLKLGMQSFYGYSFYLDI
jgi:hypothetical protein